jgi:hypothetical protein
MRNSVAFQLLAVEETSGNGRWEEYDAVWRRWKSIGAGTRLTAGSLLRAVYTSSFGLAQLTVDDDRNVRRCLIHLLLPAAEAVKQLDQTLTMAYSIPPGGSQLIDVSTLWPLRERVVNASHLEQCRFRYQRKKKVLSKNLSLSVWSLIQSKASMLDLSSAVLRNIYQFKRNRTKSAAWTVQWSDARLPEINFTVQYSVDQGTRCNTF